MAVAIESCGSMAFDDEGRQHDTFFLVRNVLFVITCMYPSTSVVISLLSLITFRYGSVARAR